MVLLVPFCLADVEQGYYYTFASLLALQIFFDLGMNQVILQLVSHGAAHIDRGAGDQATLARMARLGALVTLLRRWYAVASLAFLVVVSAAGAWFLARDHSLPASRWLGPWLALTAATAANLSLSAMLAVLEGTGEIAAVARVRFRQSLLGYGLTWIALLAGADLWAAPLLPAASAVSTAAWLHSHSWLRRMREAAPLPAGEAPLWRRDVFPLQWRMASSWIAGYFIFQLLTPLAFARQGAVEAGRLGITLAVFNAVLTAGMSWVNAKFPAIAMHLARAERRAANALFVRVTRRALAFTTAASVAVVIGLLVLRVFAPGAAQRFAGIPVALCLAAVTLCNSAIYAAASFLRAHKEEPMLAVSVVSAVFVLAGVTTASRLGILPMIASYLGVTAVVSLPWTLVIFRRYFRRQP